MNRLLLGIIVYIVLAGSAIGGAYAAVVLNTPSVPDLFKILLTLVAMGLMASAFLFTFVAWHIAREWWEYR